ncbi:virulence-associated protein [Sediminihabitans luteus]|uniref:Virulence-associated protein n=1 Tax=Sediminihabitans luteus TaxID=1138585 RepID=A0A2M9D162_9CELL|nr:VapA/VapB family virulence-associated protein [Sediminihabitans luteus]PJJ77867.1 virulence-associated protein [Sediminihabitans luteus]GII99775.1 hypothetical protein Slu03_21530 [Sediminihabitans luteus]
MSETMIDRAVVADDFAASVAEILPQDKIDAAAEQIRTATASYPATGSVASLVFWIRVSIDVTGGKSFVGNAGGIAVPGGGGFWGDVYTDDLDRLYRDTVSFQFNTTPVYFNVNFFDSSSTFLGSLQAGAFGTSTGTGGGSGSWA